MAEKNRITFNIAGLPLQIRDQCIEALPDVLKIFLFSPKQPLKSIHCLGSDMFILRDPSGRIKKKEFDDRVLSYTYSRILAMNRGLLLHAAAVLKDGRVFLFFGRSGGGKSTVATLSGNYDVIADDVVAVRKTGSSFSAFSTPWRQSGFVKTDKDITGKIAGLFFLKKSKRICFKPLREDEALARLAEQHIHFFTYTEMELAQNMFYIAGELTKSVPAYEMEFKKDEDFWPALDNIYEK